MIREIWDQLDFTDIRDLILIALFITFLAFGADFVRCCILP